MELANQVATIITHCMYTFKHFKKDFEEETSFITLQTYLQNKNIILIETYSNYIHNQSSKIVMLSCCKITLRFLCMLVSTSVLLEHGLTLSTFTFQQIDRSQSRSFTRLNYVPIHNHLIKNKMNLFQLIHNV